MPEDVDLDFKAGDGYTPKGQEGYDELAKDVTGLANARGGLIIIGIKEDAQGYAASLVSAPVDDKKKVTFTNALRARVVPWLPDFYIENVETAPGSGVGYMLIAVPASPMAPHPVRVTNRPQYGYARRVGTTTSWLEESEIAARYRDRFRLAEDHRDQVTNVLRAGAEWATRSTRANNAENLYLDLAFAPSGLAERHIDNDHIGAVRAFWSDRAREGASPRPVFDGGGTPAVLRGRLRIESYNELAAAEAYADGRLYLRTLVGWVSSPSAGVERPPTLNLFGLEYWMLVLLEAAAKYAEWAGAYGDVDILVALVGPTRVRPDTGLPIRQFGFADDPRERTDTAPVHTTSTLDALTADAVQLVTCARRLVTELLADLGYVDTKLLTAEGRIMTGRLDPPSRRRVEAWMREVDLPITA